MRVSLRGHAFPEMSVVLIVYGNDSGCTLVRRSLRSCCRYHELTLHRFSVNDLFAAGAYLKVDETVGDLIDWVSSTVSNAWRVPR